MAKMRDFNPKAVLVVRKASGISLGGRRYLQGQPVGDDCVSLRKRQQLYRQNFLCYPHDLPEGAAEAAIAREAGEQPESLKGDDKGDQLSEDGVRTNNEVKADAEAASRKVIEDAEAEAKALADADAKAAEDAQAAEDKAKADTEADAEAAAESKGNDDDKSGEAGSEEPAKPVADAEKKADEKPEEKAEAPVAAAKKKRTRKPKS